MAIPVDGREPRRRRATRSWFDGDHAPAQVDARLRAKLDGALGRAAARVDDARQLQARCVGEAADAVDACAGAQLKLADARLDTLCAVR